MPVSSSALAPRHALPGSRPEGLEEVLQVPCCAVVAVFEVQVNGEV